MPRGERSNIVIEPRLSHQWYVKTEEMAARANEAVNKGEINFILAIGLKHILIG